jgi:hypothetical protein
VGSIPTSGTKLESSNPGSPIPHPGSVIDDQGSAINDPGFLISDRRSGISDPGSGDSDDADFSALKIRVITRLTPQAWRRSPEGVREDSRVVR